MILPTGDFKRLKEKWDLFLTGICVSRPIYIPLDSFWFKTQFVPRNQLIFLFRRVVTVLFDNLKCVNTDWMRSSQTNTFLKQCSWAQTFLLRNQGRNIDSSLSVSGGRPVSMHPVICRSGSGGSSAGLTWVRDRYGWGVGGGGVWVRSECKHSLSLRPSHIRPL